MKVFYNPAMSVDSRGYSPSGSKPEKVVADWSDLDITICDFEPLTRDDMCLAHDPRFVDGILSLREPNGHGNRVAEVTGATLWTGGSMYAASKAALTEGITCSPTSGFYHSSPESCFGFCTFNGLVVSAQKLFQDGLASKVGIVDADCHFGDGTESCIRRLKLEDKILHWTYGAEQYRGWKDLKARLRDAIQEMALSGVDLILFQAGADPHVDDPLGGDMTTMDLKKRDRYVFELCRSFEIPVCWLLAGGYQREADGSIPKTLALHRNTMLEAISVYGR